MDKQKRGTANAVPPVERGVQILFLYQDEDPGFVSCEGRVKHLSGVLDQSIKLVRGGDAKHLRDLVFTDLLRNFNPLATIPVQHCRMIGQLIREREVHFNSCAIRQILNYLTVSQNIELQPSHKRGTSWKRRR